MMDEFDEFTVGSIRRYIHVTIYLTITTLIPQDQSADARHHHTAELNR
jgi:hypothetical protein